MHLTERILGFTLLGSEWVLWVLIGLSVLSVAVMVERAICCRRAADATSTRSAQELLRLPPATATSPARAGAGGEARARGRRSPPPGSSSFDRGADAVSEAMASAKSRLRLDLERNLGILGTLGNNAPFIGLFGTVLGIIKAFADLSRNQAGGAAAVMSGHLRGAGRDRGRPDGGDPGRHRLQLLPGQGAQRDGPRRRHGPPDPLGDRRGALDRARRRPRPRRAARLAMAGGASFGGDDDGGGMIVDINVTPLVDITLVLLIIFMVTASYIVSPAIKVDLPKAASGTRADQDHAGADAGQGRRALPERRALATTRPSSASSAASCRKNPDLQAIIAADAVVPHGDVVHVIDLVKRAGVHRFAINVDPNMTGK